MQREIHRMRLRYAQLQRRQEQMITEMERAVYKRDNIEAKGGTWSAKEEDAFRSPIREQYETQGHPYYATARLWDDGVIDPADTRLVLGLGLSAAANAPIEPPKFGVFRM